MNYQPSLLQIPIFERHMHAQTAARTAGACWPCCWEAGMRATDATVPREKVGEMHAECAKRIERSR
jgi:hypothetical protein